MKLYELTSNYRNLMELLDVGEVPKDLLSNSMNEIEEDIKTKVENIAKIIKTKELEKEAIKKEENRLIAKRKATENNIKSLKEYIEESFRSTGKTKIKTNLFTIYLQKNTTTVEVVDIKKIPKLYKTEDTIIKVDKNRIKEIIKNGGNVEGIEIKQTESLRIR
ncbi:siphovirus Gp157 family protein [Clostridium rectalis]|uniref:siphovirus Gp157 family protein n=1 Tax=Clostridium rectalis TaxID=2040295 RepID=UPI000F631A39|nr:siphovirus Gp157 family protein [Clostridium rectalis]